MQIRGNTVLITGGCGGIGLAVAQEFLDRDKTVVLCDVDTSQAKKLKNRDGRLVCVECNLMSADEMDRKLAPVIQSEFSPDILVNAVGRAPKTDAAGRPLTIETTDIDLWNDVFATNVTSYFYCAKLVLAGMISRGNGRIINIGSYVARTGGLARNSVVYVASKSAILGLTKAMARELAQHGITVNAINPGRIKTEMNRDISSEETQEFVKRIPLQRLGLPEDVAGAILFLASDKADYMTGAALEVNGGLYMGS